MNFCFEAERKIGPWLVDGTGTYVRRLLYSLSFIDGLSLSATRESIQSIQYNNYVTYRTSA